MTTPTQFFLQPGEILIARKPALISTVLGSCVAVTLFCPGQKVGAICHAMLPEGKEPGGKYLNQAMDLMLLRLAERGILPAAIEAKLFGGADMFETVGTGKGVTVGCMNIRAARHALQQTGLALRAEDVGGPLGRKIQFNTETGEVLLRRLERQALRSLRPGLI